MGNTSLIRNIGRRLAAAGVALALAISPVSLSHAQDGEKIGGGLGGAIGGVLGNVLGKKGDKTITTLLGITIGALVGSRIGKGLSKQDKERVAVSTSDTLATGRPGSWTGEKGVSGRTELTHSEKRSGKANVPVLRERVTQLPPLDLANENFQAIKKDVVRGGPGLDYKVVGQIKKNEIVAVAGKVQEIPWYLVTQNGVGIGFVSAKSLKATAGKPVAESALSGTVEKRSVEVNRVCRTVKQTVVKNGKEQTESVTACQTADGWEVV